MYCLYIQCMSFILSVRKLENPHIIKLYGTSLLKKGDISRVILVMEKGKGNLESHICCHPVAAPAKATNPAVFRDVCHWARQITSALAFIHNQGLIHSSPELRHVSGLYVMFWTFLLNLAFFIKSWLLIVYLYVKILFSDNLLDLGDHVTDHALYWKKSDHLSLKTLTY